MNSLEQFFLITLIGIRSIPLRLGASVTAAFGVAGVVTVMVAVLSIAAGFRATLANTGSSDTALVLRSGTDSEMSSNLTLDAVRIIADGPGIRRGPDGPVASAELFVIVDVPMRSTGTKANVPLRGVEPAAFAVREDVRIVQGRRFEAGRNEIIVGANAARQFAGVDLGSRLHWNDSDWTVVGVFESGGNLSESELWCDVKVLQPVFRRGSNFQSVYAKLESVDSFDTLKDALTSDPRLSVKVIREDEYYLSTSEMQYNIIAGLGGIVAGLMAVGAVFGAIITMYSAVAARTREIATLRALGFGSWPVVLSILAESMLLALAGGVVGGVVAYFGFNGIRAATLNFQTFSQVVFEFAVTPPLIVLGVIVSMAMGLLAGLFPAVRAARLPVSIALREL